MIEIEDAVLLWRFKRGSQDALRYIYEKYRCDLVTVAVNLLGDTNSAEDVARPRNSGRGASIFNKAVIE